MFVYTTFHRLFSSLAASPVVRKALIIVMLCGIANSVMAEEIYNITITDDNKPEEGVVASSATCQFTLGGVTWIAEQSEQTATYYAWQWDDNGLKMGSTKYYPTDATISTSDLAQYSITKVIVTAKTGSSTESTLSVTVGGTTFTCTAIGDEVVTEETTAPSLTSTDSKYTFEYAAGAAGEVVISYDVTKTSGALYFVGVTVYNDGKIYPQLSYSDSYLPVDSIDLADNIIPYPYLTYVNTFTDIASVTYTSSDTNIATVDSDGTVKVKGVDGTTTITATYAGSDAFSHDATSYELRYKNESHTFDFNLRKYGIPYVTHSSTSDNVKEDTTFEGHGVTMNIIVGTSNGYGILAQVFEFIDALHMEGHCQFSLTAPAGKFISSIFFIGSELTELYADTGSLDIWEGHRTWLQSNGVYVNSVLFSLGGGDAQISSIDVTYADVATGQFVITDAEYATYYTDHAYIMPANVVGSTVTGVNDDGELATSWEYPASSTVPAMTPLVLHGPANTYTYAITESDNATPEGNLLYGSLVDMKTYVTDAAADDYYFYELTKGSYGVGFYWAKDGGAPFISEAHKAWLPMPKTVAPAKAITIGKSTTGIEQVTTAATRAGREGIYTLQGIRCNDMTKKGIYIVDGKKVVKR